MQCLRQDKNRCTKYLNDQMFKKQFKDSCIGKTECSLEPFDDLLIDDIPDSLSDRCMDQSSRIFIQFFCKQTQADLKQKQEMANLNVTIEVIS